VPRAFLLVRFQVGRECDLSGLSGGNCHSIFRLATMLSDTRKGRRALGRLRTQNEAAASSVATIPVDVGRLIPTAARSRDSVSPQTPRTHIATNKGHERRSSTRMRPPRLPEEVAEQRGAILPRTLRA
jgi:hypothetical protein